MVVENYSSKLSAPEGANRHVTKKGVIKLLVRRTLLLYRFKTCLEVTTFSCSTKLSLKFIQLINVTMPTVVSSLTYNSSALISYLTLVFFL